MYTAEDLRKYRVWKHASTQDLYVVLGTAVCATNGPRDGVEESVVYMGSVGGRVWYRELPEFLDGRFVPLEVA